MAEASESYADEEMEVEESSATITVHTDDQMEVQESENPPDEPDEPEETGRRSDPKGVLIVKDPDKVYIKDNSGEKIELPWLYANLCHLDDLDYVVYEGVNEEEIPIKKSKNVKLHTCNFEKYKRTLLRYVPWKNKPKKKSKKKGEKEEREIEEGFFGVCFNHGLPNRWMPLSYKTNLRMCQVADRNLAKLSDNPNRKDLFDHKCRVFNCSDKNMYYLNHYDTQSCRFLLDYQGFDFRAEANMPRCQILEIRRPVSLMKYSKPGVHQVEAELRLQGEEWMKDKYLGENHRGKATFDDDQDQMNLAVDIVARGGAPHFVVEEVQLEQRMLTFFVDFTNPTGYERYKENIPLEIPFNKFCSQKLEVLSRNDEDNTDFEVEITFWTKKIARPKHNIRVPTPGESEIEARKKFTFEKFTNDDRKVKINKQTLSAMSLTLTTEFRDGGRFPAVQTCTFGNEWECCVEHGDVSKSWIGSYGTKNIPVHVEASHGNPSEMLRRWSKLTLNTHAYECVSMPNQPFTTHIEDAFVFFNLRTEKPDYPWVKAYFPFAATSLKKAGIVFPKPGIRNLPNKNAPFSIDKYNLRLNSYLACVCLEIASTDNNVPVEYVGQKFHFIVYDKKHFPGMKGMAVVKMRMVPISGKIFPQQLLNTGGRMKRDEHDNQRDEAKARYEQFLYLKPNVKWVRCNMQVITMGESYRRKIRALLNLNELCPPKQRPDDEQSEMSKFVLGQYELDPRNSGDVSKEEITRFKRFLKGNGYECKLNDQQIKAIINCLGLKFSLMWGPPGTGKSETCAIMAIYESLRLLREKRPDDDVVNVVVVHAPSNEAANVVFEKICDTLDANKNNELKVLRVFANTYEEYEYPFRKGSTKKEEMLHKFGNTRYSDRWSHHKIRKVDETGDYARFLLLYDDAFKTAYGGETFSEHEKFHLRSEYRYKQVHDKAERGAIMTSNIIVTTTSSFSYERYNRFTEEVKENEQNDEQALNDRDNDEDKFDDDDKVWEATKDFKIEAPSGYEKLKRIFYHTVINDEATMATEPETLVALETATDAPNFTLIGDHKQLGPVDKCKESKNFGAETSYFSRYAQKFHLRCAMLKRQYRMNKHIQAYPNQQFYRSELVVAVPEIQDVTLLRDEFWTHFYEDNTPKADIQPVVFVNISGIQVLDENVLDDRERSFFNMEEVQVAVKPNIYTMVTSKSVYYYNILLKGKIANHLIQIHHVAPEKIAVLSIYTAQRKQIDAALVNNNMQQVVSKTVRTSQGKEWDYVIVSCVKSRFASWQTDEKAADIINGNLGLLGVENDFNVAITRAKHGLIVVGNEKVLIKNKDVLEPWLLKHRRVDWDDSKLENLFQNVAFNI